MADPGTLLQSLKTLISNLNKILKNQLIKRIELFWPIQQLKQISFKEILVEFHSIFLCLCWDHKEMVKWKSEKVTIWQNNNGWIYTIPFQDTPEVLKCQNSKGFWILWTLPDDHCEKAETDKWGKPRFSKRKTCVLLRNHIRWLFETSFCSQGFSRQTDSRPEVCFVSWV